MSKWGLACCLVHELHQRRLIRTQQQRDGESEVANGHGSEVGKAGLARGLLPMTPER
jgi:hypothetical protein